MRESLVRRVPAPKEMRKPKGYGEKPKRGKDVREVALEVGTERVDWYVPRSRSERS